MFELHLLRIMHILQMDRTSQSMNISKKLLQML